VIKAAKVPFFWAIFFAILISVGCSSGKKSQDPSLAGQVYHDITARNNAYFNGTQKIKTIQKSIETSYQDNFDTILVLRTNRDPAMAKTYGSDLDEVVKKASAAIKRHEPSKWTDDAYLLVGKSYFLKGDYDAALETFKFVNTTFKEELKKSEKKKEVKKKKKKKSNSKKKKSSKKKKKKKKSSSKKNIPIKTTSTQPQPTAIAKKPADEKKKSSSGLLKPVPVRPQAWVWLVDTYTEIDKFKEADAVVTFIEADEEFPKKLKREFEISKAHLAVKRGNLESAIEPLTQAIEFTKKKKYKARYYYVLAQIYENTAQYPNAITNYQEVLKNRPKFDLEFNAKISIARIARKDRSLSTNEITMLLKKLLKDAKNQDFFDQVYYSLAEFALSRGNKEEALDYLEKSVKSSTTNVLQKALSYNKMTEIYFNDQLYVKAQPYSDSTMAILPTDYKGFDAIAQRDEVLRELVRHLQTIEEQDSMLRIASMTEDEREKLVDDIIRKKEKELERNDIANDPSQIDPMVNDKTKREDPNATASTSGWYFYNVNAKSTGFNNFIKRWGNRNLEDDWRRNNKSSAAFDDQASFDDDSLQQTASLSDANLDKEALLKAIPLTNEQVQRSNAYIIDALYRLGNIYRIDLKNYKKAVEAFEELLKRFPGNKHEPETYYSLYLLHAEMGNAGKAVDYKNSLLNKYPNSRYAQYLLNPDLLETEKRKDRKLQDYYSGAYEMYLNNQLAEALVTINQADSIFPRNELQSKFALLEAQVIAKTQDVPKYLDALQSVIDDFPTTPERNKAEEILNYLKVKEDSSFLMQINISEYKYDVDATHFFVASYNTDSVNTNNLINAVASYNDLNRSLEDLKINSVALDDKHAFLVVKSFKNMKTSINYYNAISASADTFKDFPPGTLEFCVISDVNFNKVIMHSEIESYFRFFEARYITNQ